jgi:hypothetical protein
MPLAIESTSAQFKEGMKNLRAELGSNLVEFSFDLDEYFPKNAIPHMDDARPQTLADYQRVVRELIVNKADVIRAMHDVLIMRQTFEMYQQATTSFTHATLNTQPPSVPHTGWLDRLLPARFRHSNGTSLPANNSVH